jgi:antitoxin component of MazEF toxin-antitoxin module
VTTSTKIRAVGNSKGVILPKKYLDECGIHERVDITVKDNTITIAAAKAVVKKKWTDFSQPGKKRKTALVANKFDENDWTW